MQPRWLYKSHEGSLWSSLFPQKKSGVRNVSRVNFSRRAQRKRVFEMKISGGERKARATAHQARIGRCLRRGAFAAVAVVLATAADAARRGGDAAPCGVTLTVSRTYLSARENDSHVCAFHFRRLEREIAFFPDIARDRPSGKTSERVKSGKSEKRTHGDRCKLVGYAGARRTLRCGALWSGSTL